MEKVVKQVKDSDYKVAEKIMNNQILDSNIVRMVNNLRNFEKHRV